MLNFWRFAMTSNMFCFFLQTFGLFMNFIPRWCKTSPKSDLVLSIYWNMMFFVISFYIRDISDIEVSLHSWINECAAVSLLWLAHISRARGLLSGFVHISHFCALGFDLIQAVFTSHCLSVMHVFVIFSLWLCLSLCILFSIFCLSLTPCLHNHSSFFLSPVIFPLWPSCVTQHSPLQCTSPLTLCRHVIIS